MIGLSDLKRSLPVEIFLWFCDGCLKYRTTRPNYSIGEIHDTSTYSLSQCCSLPHPIKLGTGQKKVTTIYNTQRFLDRETLRRKYLRSYKIITNVEKMNKKMIENLGTLNKVRGWQV